MKPLFCICLGNEITLIASSDFNGGLWITFFLYYIVEFYSKRKKKGKYFYFIFTNSYSHVFLYISGKIKMKQQEFGVYSGFNILSIKDISR